MRASFAVVLSGLLAVVTLPVVAAPPDWSDVAVALGKSGTQMQGDVYRVSLPRSDLHVTLDGVELKPALALGSWLAFRSMNDKATVMGDLVLTESEISRDEEAG
jgi:hypothetical protein